MISKSTGKPMTGPGCDSGYRQREDIFDDYTGPNPNETPEEYKKYLESLIPNEEPLENPDLPDDPQV